MAKDPAFLLYSKDWLQGTAKLFPAEKGVFIDLLAHQHQDGYLPSNKKRLAKMVGLGEAEFNEIWEVLKDKFKEEDGKIYNEKLSSVINSRGEHGEMRAIVGAFGQISKSLFCSDEQKALISKKFNYEDFLGIERAKLSKEISIWVSNCLTSDGNGIKDGDKINVLNEKALIPEMFSAFKKILPKYPGFIDKDFKPLKTIADFIHEQSGLNGNIINNQKVIMKEWEKLCIAIAANNFYKQKSLSVISNQIQNIFQISNDGDTSTFNKKSGVERSVTNLLSGNGKW